jgi:sugar transferase (PEP-CTERM system associated)
MITLVNRFFPIRSAVCFIVEGGIIIISVLFSFLILHTGNEPYYIVSFEEAMVRGFVVAFFCQICMYFLDLYDLRHSQTWGEMFFSLVIAIGFVCIGIGFVCSAIPSFATERQIYLLSILFVSIFLLFWRIVFDIYLARFAPHEKILIVGSGEMASLIGQELRKRQRLGFRLVGYLVAPGIANPYPVGGTGKILGDHTQLEEIVEAHGIHKVVVAITERRGEYPVKQMLALRVGGCQVIEWPAFFEKLSGRIPIDNLAPSYFIFNEGFRKSRVHLFIRRVVSSIIAAAMLVILCPILLVISLIIKFDSPGPVIYSQIRVGQKGRLIRIYKFRSMRKDAEQNGNALWAVVDDPRITRVGRFLRKTRIDELPQLFNVLVGELDFVGPRPERPEFVEKLQSLIPYYSLRHTVKPGLTGWAQVMFHYGATLEESKEKLQYDLFYIKNMSIKLDLMILFQTMKIVILGRGAR